MPRMGFAEAGLRVRLTKTQLPFPPPEKKKEKRKTKRNIEIRIAQGSLKKKINTKNWAIEK